jgi:4-amino-4-deoxy-L-arabinose transferase-like glycosyltransferase
MKTHKWVLPLILLGLCFLIYFVNLGRWDLWDPDEPRYAQVSREMVSRGDWILMHLNGRTYGDKPPLFFWLIALSSYLWGGFTSFSARIPSAFLGTLTVLLTFYLGKRLDGLRTGFFSALILATSSQYAYLSTRANIDTTLTFFTTASLFFFLDWDQWRTPEEERQEDGRRLSIYGFYICTALATLAKGPVGVLLPLLVCLIYLLVRRDWRAIRRMKWLPGVILFLVIVLSWYVPAVLRGGRPYLMETLFKHTVDAYAKGWTHVKPVYYYLYNFPLSFLPWMIFLPAAFAYCSFKDTIGKRREVSFPIVWFAVIFLFFSLSKGKRSLYLLPLYPAASLMVGKLWNDFVSAPMQPFKDKLIFVPLYGLMGSMFIIGLAIPWVVLKKFPSYLSYSLPVALLMVGGSLILFFLCRFKSRGAIFYVIIGMLAAGYFYASGALFPLINPVRTERFLAQKVGAHILPGEKLSVYGKIDPVPYNFYLDIVPIMELNTKEALFDYLNSSERVFCVLSYADYSRLLIPEGSPKVQLLLREKVGKNDAVLISSR